MRNRTVTIMPIINGDGSTTFHLRWKGYNGKYVSRRAMRTEPNPTKARLAHWWRQVSELRLQKERELSADNGFAHDVKRVSPQEALDIYLAAIEGPLAELTVDRRKRVLRGFVGHVRCEDPPQYVTGITPFRVREYATYLYEVGMKASTIACYLTDISAWFNWLIDERYAASNPVKKSDKPKVYLPRVEPKIVGAAGFWKAHDSLEDRQHRATFGVLATTGLRIGEASRLQWGDWVGNELSIVGIGKYERTKRHTRVLPVAKATKAFLVTLRKINDQGPHIIGVEKGTRKLTSQCKVWFADIDVTPQDLRRWYRMAMEAVAAPSDLIDDLMGHKASKIRSAYAGYNIDLLAEWVRKFDLWLAQPK